MATPPTGQPVAVWVTLQQQPGGLPPLPRLKACHYDNNGNCIYCPDAHEKSEQVYLLVFPQDDTPSAIPHVPTLPS